MEFNLDTVLSEKNILLAIEKTLNSNQNIELKNPLNIQMLRYFTLYNQNPNSEFYVSRVKEIVSDIRNRITQLYDEGSVKFIEYFKPKKFNMNDNEGFDEYRPLLIHSSIIDEVAVNAITLVFSDRLRTVIPKCNFGNVLANYESKTFFKPYFTQYKKFTQRRFDNINKNLYNYMITFDIRKFYERIDIDVLFNIIKDYYDIKNEFVQDTITIYKRMCKSGLPQGPLFSHFFASLLIYDLETEFQKSFPYCSVINYVDDINVFLNATSVDEAIQQENNITQFLIDYLSKKLISKSDDILNSNKQQLIEITEENYLSRVLLQISAFNEFRQSNSSNLTAFDRNALTSDLNELYNELLEELNSVSVDNNVIGSLTPLNENTINNIIEKTLRFKTYREILFSNNWVQLKQRISSIIENDIKRGSVGLTEPDNKILQSFFDKSFENYIRAFLSCCDVFDIEENQIKGFIQNDILGKIDIVFKNSDNLLNYKNTFNDIVNHLMSEYKDYKQYKTKKNILLERVKYKNEYNIETIKEFLEEILLHPQNKAYETDFNIDMHITQYLTFTIDSPKEYIVKDSESLYLVGNISIVLSEVKSSNLLRYSSFNQSLFDLFCILFHYKPNNNSVINPYDKEGELLTLFEYRLLNIFSHTNVRTTQLVKKALEIINAIIDEDDNELCDPLINNVTRIVRKKIRDFVLIDSCIVSHHYIRDVWKNGARDLPFFTLHNHEHSYELIKILDALNAASRGMIFNYLNVYEFYVLIMSIYFHDLGMLFFSYEDLDNLNFDSLILYPNNLITS